MVQRDTLMAKSTHNGTDEIYKGKRRGISCVKERLNHLTAYQAFAWDCF